MKERTLKMMLRRYTIKKALKIAGLCVAAIVVNVLVFVGAFWLNKVTTKQYATSDINDYGHYIVIARNEYASNYINAFFPERIESSFTDVTYSYRAQNNANYAFEAYLEFVIEDEEAFREFISAKTSGLECKEFPYDPNFIEYTLVENEYLEIYVYDGEDNQNSKIGIDDARIGKILCNAEEHRIIFVAMAMSDAWNAYSDFFCCYFDRFNIDPIKYEDVRF